MFLRIANLFLRNFLFFFLDCSLLPDYAYHNNGGKMTVYTIKDLEKLLGLSRRTLEEMLRTGEMPGSKLGGSWRITEQQLQEYFDRNSNQKGQEND